MAGEKRDCKQTLSILSQVFSYNANDKQPTSGCPFLTYYKPVSWLWQSN